MTTSHQFLLASVAYFGPDWLRQLNKLGWTTQGVRNAKEFLTAHGINHKHPDNKDRSRATELLTTPQPTIPDCPPYQTKMGFDILREVETSQPVIHIHPDGPFENPDQVLRFIVHQGVHTVNPSWNQLIAYLTKYGDNELSRAIDQAISRMVPPCPDHLWPKDTPDPHTYGFCLTNCSHDLPTIAKFDETNIFINDEAATRACYIYSVNDNECCRRAFDFAATYGDPITRHYCQMAKLEHPA